MELTRIIQLLFWSLKTPVSSFSRPIIAVERAGHPHHQFALDESYGKSGKHFRVKDMDLHNATLYVPASLALAARFPSVSRGTNR